MTLIFNINTNTNIRTFKLNTNLQDNDYKLLIEHA